MSEQGIVKRWLQAGAVLLAGAALLLGCRGTPATTAGLGTMKMGRATAEVRIKDKLAQASPQRYGVQFVDWNRASYAVMWVAGVGLDGLVPVDMDQDGDQDQFNFWTDGGTNERVVNFNITLPTGARRVVKVEIRDGSGNYMDELWSVEDIPEPGASAVAIPIDAYTTPTGRIFRDLFATGDKDKTEALATQAVQDFVDSLLDFDRDGNQAGSATGFDGNLDGQIVPLHPALLTTYPLTVAIANGARDRIAPFDGMRDPYTVPTPVPVGGYTPDNPELFPTPKQWATVTVTALDSNGLQVTTPCLFFLNDVVSPIQLANGSFTFAPPNFPVALGPSRWATVIDTATGRRASVQLVPDLSDKETRNITVALPFNKVDRAYGTYNLAAKIGSGFNGDDVHHSFAYMNDPRQLVYRDNAAHGGAGASLYFADVGNTRLRGVRLNDADARVRTVAGASSPVSLTAATDLALDENGDLLFNEVIPASPPVNRIARVDLDAAGVAVTGQPTTFVDMANVAGWPAGMAPGAIAYDAGSRKLYVAPAGQGSIFAVDMATYPAAGASTVAGPGYVGGGICLAGGYLFYTVSTDVTYDDMSTDPPTPVTVTVRSLVRRRLSDGLTTPIVADAARYLTLRYGMGEAMDLGYTLPALNFFAPSTYDDITVDMSGNLYFMMRDPAVNSSHWKSRHTLFRVTGVTTGTAAANSWLVSFLDLHDKLGQPKNVGGSSNPSAFDIFWGMTLGPAGALTNDLYCTGVTRYPDPNGAGTQNVHSIYKVQL